MRRKNKSIVGKYAPLAAGLFLLPVLLGPATYCFAEVENDGANPSVLLEDLFGEKVDDFVYIREGRPDPFMPYKEAEEVVVEKKKEVVEEELTGMRQFEPGQLTLVAIVFGTAEPVAMVQDSTNKGYAIRKGTKIGRHGVVEDIIPNQVIIRKTTVTMAGDKRYSKVKMVLKKEGDQ
jgi:type IV pilus assembly protein PilP